MVLRVFYDSNKFYLKIRKFVIVIKYSWDHLTFKNYI